MKISDQRQVANNRERNRTLKLNQAFKQLQSKIPKEPSDKMTKIHTLKLALIYIEYLDRILKETDMEVMGDVYDGKCIKTFCEFRSVKRRSGSCTP